MSKEERASQGGREKLEQRVLECLVAAGHKVDSVVVDEGHLKGGYICDTCRVHISYSDGAKASAVLKRQCDPATEVDPYGPPGDDDVARRLHLYEREWHFYESGLSAKVPIRVPAFLCALKDEQSGASIGVLLEDLCQPGAVLNPQLDTAGVVLVAQHCAKLHARYWNSVELGALGLKPHDDAAFCPSWGDAVAEYWPRFEEMWRGTRQGELSEDAYAAGAAIVANYAWVQSAVSSQPHTFVHGDVKPGNMFLMADGAPAFIDWQYTAVGKGVQDLAFMLIEGYDQATCAALEPTIKAAYHAALLAEGVADYSAEALERDWRLATLHFPFYVAMWFGTTADEDLVDPSFPRRFVPRAFDAILRHNAQALLPGAIASKA